MESDINSPKSKAFNIFLRFFQLALSLASTLFVTELVEKACVTPNYRIIEILVAAALLISLIGLVTLKCSSAHPKVAFGVLFVLQVGALGAVAGVSIKEMMWGEECAVSGVFNHYYLGAIALYALTVAMVLLLPLLWVQRYSNSPGNIIWAIFLLKVVMQWPTAFRWTIAALAAAVFLQTLLTLVVNLVAGCKGVTTTIKSVVKCAWIFDLLLLVGTEVVVVGVYMNSREGGHFAGFDGTQTRVVLEAFMLINLVDLVFWLYGLQTLDYENGDSVRDELVRFGLDPTFDEQSDVHDYDPKAQFPQLA
jgi:hypothetical protein